MARMQAGDGDVFEACVRTYCGQMLLAARRILRNEEDANDARAGRFPVRLQGN